MTDLTTAHTAAHEENVDRTVAAGQDAKDKAVTNAAWQDANAKARDAYNDLPRFEFSAVIAHGGKVHRVYSPSRKFLNNPYCGSSRWNRSRAHAVDAEVTCQKCLHIS